MGRRVTDALFDGADEAATPLTPDEREGLILTHITTRDELNEAEGLNINEAYRWAFRRSWTSDQLLDIEFMRGLHKRMLGRVWKWAGTWTKQRNRRIGVDAHMVEIELFRVIGDVKFWIENKTYEPDEIALRLHHQLTLIHPFPNGNGRFSRLMAELLVGPLGRRRFTWGNSVLVDDDETRRRYIASLRLADHQHEFAALMEFARS